MSMIGNTALHFSEEQAMLLDVAREFCREQSPMSHVREQLETERGYDQGTWQAMVELGWAGIALPEACGGSAMGVATVVPVVESMGRAMLGTPLLSSTLAGQLLQRAAGSSLAESLLAEIAGGTPATVALLDNADWGDETPSCSIDEKGCLQGEKKLVMDAGVASIFLVVLSRDGAPALAIVRSQQLPPGAIRPCTLIDQTRRAANVDFSGVTVDRDALITGASVAGALRDLRLLGACSRGAPPWSC